MTKLEIVEELLRGRSRRPQKEEGKAFAPANIALVKYWGKRDEELNLPVTSSLSVSLGRRGSEVCIRPCENGDRFYLNGELLPADSLFARRLRSYLDLFRPEAETGFEVVAINTIPTAAGFASSASGFAALVLALNDLFQWQLDLRTLSILARLGSGSACRSVYEGFVLWHAGNRPDGLDSFAERLEETWPSLRLGLCVICDEVKAVSSREGMRRTTRTSPLYAAWSSTVEKHLADLRVAIAQRDFQLLGKTAESNALAMHATMLAAWPPLMYWLPETVETLHRVWRLRDQGVPVYFTMDAGPNPKLLFEQPLTDRLEREFPGLVVIAPFEPAS